MTELQLLPADAWRAAVGTAISEHGERFAGAWATREGAWRAVMVSDQQARVLSCVATDGRAPTIVDLAGGALWDEREAHDLYGLDFDGHEPMRALISHPPELADWVTPVEGDGVHQVAVGPIHAGVIESGHFRFHVVGERILAMDPRLFYKHRGLERAAEGLEPPSALPYAARACAACAVANTLAFAHAVEDATGLWPSPELRRQRTILLELERLYNHLHDIGAICAGVGFAPGTMAFSALKDRAQTLNRDTFGHRFLFGAVAVGHTAGSPDAAALEALRAGLRELRVDAAAAWRELEFAASLQARLGQVGVLTREDALRLGAVGPAARASGVIADARVGDQRLACEGLHPATLQEQSGDVAARFRIRAVELQATHDLLEELLGEPAGHGGCERSGAPSQIGVGRVESARGETLCAVELDDGRTARMRLRTASYANWPALAHATAGNLLPDFPLINKSFELCYACVDR